MLEVRDVHKTFGSLEVLKGVGLRVSQGDVVAILGPSGSGKTTLLRCINFLETAGSGTMIFDGETFQMERMSRKDVARLRKKTAFVFQSYNLFRNKTALQNVTEGLITARKMPKDQAEDAAMKALRKVGMADSSSVWPSPGPWPRTRRLSTSTSPPPPWTRSSRARCSPSCGTWRRRAGPCWW